MSERRPNSASFSKLPSATVRRSKPSCRFRSCRDSGRRVGSGATSWGNLYESLLYEAAFAGGG